MAAKEVLEKFSEEERKRKLSELKDKLTQAIALYGEFLTLFNSLYEDEDDNFNTRWIETDLNALNDSL